MKNLICFLLAAIPLQACASSKPKTGQLMVIPASADDLRRKEFFLKSLQVKHQGDPLTIDALLQLPEVEIPLEEARFEQYNMKRQVDNAIHVFNGHVCIQIGVKSGNTVDYSTAKWTSELKIDGIKAKSRAEPRVRRVLDLNQGNANVIPGETDITVCSFSKFRKVKRVSLNLMMPKKKSVAKFEWAQPWP
ncbi:MAG: hypothetical protein AB7N80_07605 [Bdellovibrionales bacterium]